MQHVFPWQRLSHDSIPIYVGTGEPNWFVPNPAAEALLEGMRAGKTENTALRRVLARLPQSRPLTYAGRGTHLRMEGLRELWLHLTDRCNMACTHCLFASSPTQKTELPLDTALSLAEQALDLGCRLFALTGGEPLVHPHIKTLVQTLLAKNDVHVVMLTNALRLLPFLDELRPDPERFHLQISLDGLREHHDALRGRGAFDVLLQTLEALRLRRISFTLSMCVTARNVREMASVAALARRIGAGNLHFMWYFLRGRGTDAQWVAPDILFDEFQKAVSIADSLGLPVDNVAALATQIFAPAGTIHDGGTAGWESLAVGPDGLLYPSAALIGLPQLATTIQTRLAHAWETSPILNTFRQATAATSDSPLRLLLGGGDCDHSYSHAQTVLGDDPYLPLYERIALWLIAREAQKSASGSSPGLLLQMGEILESCGAHGNIALTHSNCLLATAQENSLTTIKNFYTQAVGDKNTDILNPVCYDTPTIAHIPERFRFRGYGCGSPVLDAAIQPGEHVLDLGCGGGVECFIAARLCGESGAAVGVDMLGPMLELARAAQPEVAENLGYDNLTFRQGYLEALPVDSDSMDVVLSNCVMNLSVHKRRAYAEIFRVLRPGGRLVISDVVCESEPDPSIRNDETLRGECIAGALTIPHLMALLAESGFLHTRLVKRFPYRLVHGHPFFSLTYEAFKPRPSAPVRLLYRGPLEGLLVNGTWLPRGVPMSLDRDHADRLGEEVFVLDDEGNALNVAATNTCACFTPAKTSASTAADHPATRHATGCMVCGAPLHYMTIPEERVCAFCGQKFAASACCAEGHFVCDACHAEDALDVIRHLCLHSTATDLIELLNQIRRHPAVPMHGPEHHALVPAIILAAYRNSGGNMDDNLIGTGLDRGKTIAGGFCGFMGICGAAVGVGIAFSILLEATPLKAKERKMVQSVVQEALADIARLKAARCCQRECWLALRKAAALSATLLPRRLHAEFPLVCDQMHRNAECLGKGCPLHP